MNRKRSINRPSRNISIQCARLSHTRSRARLFFPRMNSSFSHLPRVIE